MQDVKDFARQLDELTRQSYAEVAKMGSMSADLLQQRYILDTIRNQLMELHQAKRAIAQEMLQIIGPPRTPPPLPVANEYDEFVGQIAERFRPVQDHPHDPYGDGLTDWAHARRAAE